MICALFLSLVTFPIISTAVSRISVLRVKLMKQVRTVVVLVWGLKNGAVAGEDFPDGGDRTFGIASRRRILLRE